MTCREAPKSGIYTMEEPATARSIGDSGDDGALEPPVLRSFVIGGKSDDVTYRGSGDGDLVGSGLFSLLREGCRCPLRRRGR
jgi:hypothetical protein